MYAGKAHMMVLSHLARQILPAVFSTYRTIIRGSTTLTLLLLASLWYLGKEDKNAITTE